VGPVALLLNSVSDDTDCIATRSGECAVYQKTGKVEVYAILRNNTSDVVKDVTIECKRVAKSGTVLSSVFLDDTDTIYDSFPPSEKRNISFKVDKDDRGTVLSCRATKWVKVSH
jgi:hypothetical protein